MEPALSSPSAAPIDFHKIAPPRELGPGYLRGATPDGSAVYVSDPDPAFPEPGCEGQPESVLFRLELAAGSQREVLKIGDKPLKDLIVRGLQGKIALVDICEGFFQGLQVGTESPDGKITGTSDVKLTNDPARGQPAAFSMSWSTDGSKLLAAINDPNAPDGGPARVVTIDPQSGAVSELFDGGHGSGVFQVAQLENGTYVVSSNRVVEFRDAAGKITATFRGNGFTVAPDRRSIVMYGEQLSTAGQADTEARLLVGQKANHEISGADISPDGKAALFNRYDLTTGTTEIALITLTDGKLSTIGSGPGSGEALFTGDGRAVAFNRINGKDGSATVQLVALGG